MVYTYSVLLCLVGCLYLTAADLGLWTNYQAHCTEGAAVLVNKKQSTSYLIQPYTENAAPAFCDGVQGTLFDAASSSSSTFLSDIGAISHSFIRTPNGSLFDVDNKQIIPQGNQNSSIIWQFTGCGNDVCDPSEDCLSCPSDCSCYAGGFRYTIYPNTQFSGWPVDMGFAWKIDLSSLPVLALLSSYSILWSGYLESNGPLSTTFQSRFAASTLTFYPLTNADGTDVDIEYSKPVVGFSSSKFTKLSVLTSPPQTIYGITYRMEYKFRGNTVYGQPSLAFKMDPSVLTFNSWNSCGDGICDPVELLVNQTCPQDCASISCGDGVCQSSENYQNCWYDCYDQQVDTCDMLDGNYRLPGIEHLIHGVNPVTLEESAFPIYDISFCQTPNILQDAYRQVVYQIPDGFDADLYSSCSYSTTTESYHSVQQLISSSSDSNGMGTGVSGEKSSSEDEPSKEESDKGKEEDPTMKDHVEDKNPIRAPQREFGADTPVHARDPKAPKTKVWVPKDAVDNPLHADETEESGLKPLFDDDEEEPAAAAPEESEARKRSKREEAAGGAGEGAGEKAAEGAAEGAESGGAKGAGEGAAEGGAKGEGSKGEGSKGSEVETSGTIEYNPGSNSDGAVAASNTQSDSSSVITVTKARCLSARAKVNTPPLTLTFRTDIARMVDPDSAQPGDFTCTDFVKRYGGFSYTKTDMGGWIEQTSSTSSVYASSVSTSDVQGSASSGFSVAISANAGPKASGSFSASDSKDKTTTTTQNVTSAYDQSTTKSSLRSYGGAPGSFGPDLSTTWSSWASTVDQVPVPVDSKWQLLTALMPNTDRKNCFIKGYNAFVSQATPIKNIHNYKISVQTSGGSPQGQLWFLMRGTKREQTIYTPFSTQFDTYTETPITDWAPGTIYTYAMSDIDLGQVHQIDLYSPDQDWLTNANILSVTVYNKNSGSFSEFSLDPSAEIMYVQTSSGTSRVLDLNSVNTNGTIVMQQQANGGFSSQRNVSLYAVYDFQSSSIVVELEYSVLPGYSVAQIPFSIQLIGTAGTIDTSSVASSALNYATCGVGSGCERSGLLQQTAIQRISVPYVDIGDVQAYTVNSMGVTPVQDCYAYNIPSVSSYSSCTQLDLEVTATISTSFTETISWFFDYSFNANPTVTFNVDDKAALTTSLSANYAAGNSPSSYMSLEVHCTQLTYSPHFTLYINTTGLLTPQNMSLTVAMVHAYDGCTLNGLDSATITILTTDPNFVVTNVQMTRTDEIYTATCTVQQTAYVPLIRSVTVFKEDKGLYSSYYSLVPFFVPQESILAGTYQSCLDLNPSFFNGAAYAITCSEYTSSALCKGAFPPNDDKFTRFCAPSMNGICDNSRLMVGPVRNSIITACATAPALSTSNILNLVG